jgi:uncharacterized protein YjiS (DUF1127 family)
MSDVSSTRMRRPGAGRIMHGLVRWLRRAPAPRGNGLRRLSDHLLRDIGLDHGDVGASLRARWPYH